DTLERFRQGPAQIVRVIGPVLLPTVTAKLPVVTKHRDELGLLETREQLTRIRRPRIQDEVHLLPKVQLDSEHLLVVVPRAPLNWVTVVDDDDLSDVVVGSASLKPRLDVH